MDKLLPCPFCNTNAPMIELDREQGCKWGQVVCGCCGCKGPEVRSDYTEDGPWVDDAIKEWNARHTPEGWQLVPIEITAETGHKSGMMGDFSETVSLMCEACDGDGKNEYEADGACNECDGTGEYGLMVPVSWTTIKAIHRRIVEIAAAPKWGGE